MGRKWTEEEKKAASEKAKARQAVNQNKNPEPKQIPIPQPETIEAIKPQDYGDIEKLVNEMVNQRMQGMMMPWMQPQPMQGPQFNQRGGLVGSHERYILDPKHYPNPCDRLADEPALRRFAFKENYELEWIVSVSQYQTKDGVNTREPKFTLELHRVLYDDETGNKTNQRFTVCRAIFHEDPDAALAIAQEKGINIDDIDEREFLDEMRYLRMRDWLFEAFVAPKPQQKTRKKETVIGNKVVEIFEINSESSETIPFEQLKLKG